MDLGTHRLLESLLWTPEGGYWLLDLHLQRLAGSAAFLHVPIDLMVVRRHLDNLASQLDEHAKVRITVDAEGAVSGQAIPVRQGAGALKEPIRLGLAEEGVDSADHGCDTKRPTVESTKPRANLAPNSTMCCFIMSAVS